LNRIFAVMIALLLLAASASAQENQPPLLILQYQDDTIYQYRDGEVSPLDACSPNGESRQLDSLWMSPDSWHYAFLTRAPNVSGNANNVRICDLESSRLIPVTGPPQQEVIHSSPAWSLDGTKLTFTRLFPAQDRLEFALYDLAGRGTDVIYEREFPVSGASIAPEVTWGAVGPVAFNVNFTDQALPEFSEYVWYPAEFIAQDTNGEAVVRQLDRYYNSLRVITREDPSVMTYVVSNYDEPDQALDLATNEVVDLPPGTMVKINPLAPQEVFAQQLTFTAGEWIVGGADYSTTLGIPAPTSDTLAIAPDGQQFAFITFENYPYGGKVYILTDPQQFIASTGAGQLEGVIHLEEFDAHFGEAGAMALYWGPSMMALRP
jgi:hypothetical protein